MSLEIVIGCMYSGKTSYLIQQYKNNKDVVCINYSFDTRYSSNNNRMYNHDKEYIDCIPCNEYLKNIEQHIHNYKLILINEAQFFTDLKQQVLKWVEVYGKNVICAGLDSDYKRNKFGYLLDLIPYSDKVHKIKGLCSICKINESLFSHRLLKNEDDKQQKSIGNHYLPLCRKCYLKKN